MVNWELGNHYYILKEIEKEERNNKMAAGSSYSYSHSPPAEEDFTKSAKFSNTTLLIVSFTTFLVLAAILLCYLKLRKGKQKSGALTSPYQRASTVDITTDGYYRSEQCLEAGGTGLGHLLICFTPEQIREMTKDFSSQNLIGEGGFALVYKGFLRDGRAVAIKQLKPGTLQVEQEFKTEVNTMARAHHENLITLVGYCYSEDYRTLVFDFAENKTLCHHLYGETVMPWENRIKVAIGVANGLAYLHQGCHPQIIHRDIKPDNILLNDAFEPQIADFGLARLKDKARNSIYTDAAGTVGYIAPECATTGRLTDKSDVYSFGILLLELLTGRKAVDHKNSDQKAGIVAWFQETVVNIPDDEDFSELIDPRLNGTYNKKEMRKMVQAAICCIESRPKRRPTMGQVLNALDRKREPDFSSRIQHHGNSSLSARPSAMWRSAFGISANSESEMSILSGRTEPSEPSSSGTVPKADSEVHPMLH